MGMNRKNYIDRMSQLHRILAVVLSVLILIAALPDGAMSRVSAAAAELSFLFKDKNGNKISGISVTLTGTGQEPEVVSELSGEDGVAVFAVDKPIVGSTYKYAVQTGPYASVDENGPVTITENSSSIDITLYAPAPTGEITPSDPALTIGDTVVFEMNAVGMGELSYQWYRDGTKLNGEISSTLSLDSVLPADAGVYSCEVMSDLSNTGVKLTGTSALSISEWMPVVSVSADPVSGSPYTEAGITLTAVVCNPSGDVLLKPTGRVEFFVDGVSRGTVILDEGTAVLSSVVLTSDMTHMVYAKYFGGNDVHYQDAVSEEIFYEVGKISPAEGVDYTISTPNGDSGWYKKGGALEILPKGLFDRIREGENGNWKNNLVKTEETSVSGGDVVFYLENSVSGEISAAETVSYKLDHTPPDDTKAEPKWVTDQFGQTEWEREYIGNIYGGGKRNTDNFLYHVTLTAADSLSGVAYFKWKYKNSTAWSEPVPAIDAAVEIGVNYRQWYVNNGIDLLVCDEAGNLSGEEPIPAHNSLTIEYDTTNLQRYINSEGEDVTGDDPGGITRLIYNQETQITFTAKADGFNADVIDITINGQPVSIQWQSKDGNQVGKTVLSEGDSTVKVSAAGYGILSNETGCEVVKEEYISRIHTVDLTDPVMEVDFEQVAEPWYGDREMTVSITDKNFRPDGFYLSAYNVKDIQGNDISEFNADAFLNTLKHAAWKTEGDVHSAAITFSTEADYSFTLEYKDLANNPAASCEALPFVVDKTGPGNLRIAYVSDPVSTFLQKVTFGYYKPSVTVQIYAEDSITGIDHFNWTYRQEEGLTGNVDIESAQIDCTDTEHFSYIVDPKSAVATFTLTANEFAQYRGSLSFTAADKAGRTSDIHYGDGTAKDENGNLYDTDGGHVVVVDTIVPTRAVTYPEPQLIREQDTLGVFTGDKAERVNRENSNCVIYYGNASEEIIPVTLKIVEANFYAEDVVVKVNDAPYTISDWRYNGNERSGTIPLTNDGTYVITISYSDRSGNRMPSYQSEIIVIDRVNPVIDKYTFLPAAAGNVAKTNVFTEALEYGFYFNTDFGVEIHTSDALPSSGIERIDYRLVPYNNGVKQKEITGTLPVTNGLANIPVPEGFKGQIFTESYDLIGNQSGEVTSQAFVVDNAAPVIEVNQSSTTSYKDAAGNALYVTDTGVTVTITDTVSGIKEIGYAQSSEKASKDRKSIVLNNTGCKIGDNLGDGWIVSAMDANLVTKVTNTFSYNSDDNDIILTFDSTDRSGNRKEGVTSQRFTIDKTDPVIQVNFRDGDDADLYYAANRIADITVIERNFDASLIRASIENKFGNVPGFAFTEVSNTEHRAVIEFDEGDYTFGMSGTDLGSHAATVSYSGGNERFFYVDKTKPVVSDNFAEFGDQTSLNYFNEDKTVSISITEHNFDPDMLNLRILSKAAGSGHSTAGLTEDVAVGGLEWAANGDTYTASFTISADAVYQIEMAPVDPAGNAAEYRSTAVFEMDQTAPVVNARNGYFVSDTEAAFVDIYTYDRKEDPAPTVEFSDINIDHMKYSLIVWIPDYTDLEASPVMKPQKVYLEEDSAKSGIARGGKFTLPDFTEDGIYALELTAVDIAGNESICNINTYARLMEQDVLAFILNSSTEKKTGIYSFQYENGTPMSMRPDNFSDLNISVLAKKGTSVAIVLRDTNADEIRANAQVTTDNSIYGFTIYNFVLKSDFFKDNFSGDMDADLHLTVKNEDKRIDLGRIHIDNVAPTCDLPEDFNSWHWYLGEEPRTITISNINELLNEDDCKVYDNGKEMEFVYSSENSTVSFVLEKGWHNVGIVLRDMAGNENNIQEKANIHVGYFWIWMITAASLLAVLAAVIVVIYHVRKRKMQEKG